MAEIKNVLLPSLAVIDALARHERDLRNLGSVHDADVIRSAVLIVCRLIDHPAPSIDPSE